MATKATLKAKLKELEQQHLQIQAQAQQAQANAHAIFGAIQFCRILIQEEGTQPAEPLRPEIADYDDTDYYNEQDINRPLGDDFDPGQ